MIVIKKLKNISLSELKSIAAGYTTQYIYSISKEESPKQVTFALERIKLSSSFIKRNMFDENSFTNYQKILNNEFCLGAYDDNSLVGFIIAEGEQWNLSLWVWEFYIHTDYQRQGIGTKLIKEIQERAKNSKFRVITLRNSKYKCTSY